MLRSLLLLAGLLACTPTATPDVCAAKVAAMRTLFAQGPGGPIYFWRPEGLELPVSGHGADNFEDGMPVYIRADGGFEYTAGTVLTLAALTEVLDEELGRGMQLAENLGEPWQPRLLLIADARARASVLRDLAAVVPPTTAFVLIATVAGDTVPVGPPRPAVVQDALAQQQQPMKLFEVITAAMGPCTALADFFQAVTTTSADQRNKFFLDGLPGAVETCRCEGVDVETLVAAVWAMSGKQALDVRQLPLPLAREAAGEAVDVPADATVLELARLVEGPDRKPLRIASGP